MLLALALTGFLLSLYATLVYYTIIPGKAAWVPAWCVPEKKTCQTVFHHPDGKLLGVFNGIPAMLYYAVVLAALQGGIPSNLRWSIVVMAWLAGAVSVFLIYSLFFRVRVLCVVCLVAHGVNLLVAIGMTVWAR